jgi:hypothetical protein
MTLTCDWTVSRFSITGMGSRHSEIDLYKLTKADSLDFDLLDN